MARWANPRLIVPPPSWTGARDFPLAEHGVPLHPALAEGDPMTSPGWDATLSPSPVGVCWPRLLALAAARKGGSALHHALGTADWSRTGVFGHSMGNAPGCHACPSMARACPWGPGTAKVPSSFSSEKPATMIIEFTVVERHT